MNLNLIFIVHKIPTSNLQMHITDIRTVNPLLSPWGGAGGGGGAYLFQAHLKRREGVLNRDGELFEIPDQYTHSLAVIVD